MKLNFWQWLGVILLIIGGAYWLYQYRADKPASGPLPTAPQTAPAE